MPTEIATGLSWDVADDVGQLLSYHFMVDALAAGTAVAVMAALIGWFMVLRAQSFAGHTLSLVAFPGAAAASLLGLPAAAGYFAFCAAGALALSAGSRERSRDAGGESATIGAVQAFALALGFLFVTLYHGALTGLDALLFGTFLGIGDGQVLVLAAVAATAVAVLAISGRRLLFASVDPEVARAGGVPTRLLGAGFLLVLGLAVAATSQITGTLLVFALLVTPAATAQLITPRPGLGLALSVALALAVTWLGLACAYFSIYPVGFWVTSLSFAAYVAVRLARTISARRAIRAPAPSGTGT